MAPARNRLVIFFQSHYLYQLIHESLSLQILIQYEFSSRFIMQEPNQQVLNGGSEREHRFRYHLALAKEAFEEAREDGSRSNITRCLSHAKVALSLAKKADRSDLEQTAQLAIVDILEMADRRREAVEARIIAAAMVDNLEIEFEALSGTDEIGPRLAFVGGIPIDQVILLLDNEQSALSSRDQTKSFTATERHKSNKGEFAAIHQSQKQGALPKVVLEGRQIRDLKGRLATVLTDAPKLRRKPNFNR